MLQLSERDVIDHLSSTFKEEFKNFNIKVKFLKINNDDILTMLNIFDSRKKKNFSISKINCKYSNSPENKGKILSFTNFDSLEELDTIIKSSIFDCIMNRK